MYSFSADQLPDLYRKGGVLPIEAPRSRNSLWESYGVLGILLGGFLILLGVAMIPVEVARIFEGSLNRGTVMAFYLYPNYNADKNSQNTLISTFQKAFTNNLADKGIVPFSATPVSGKTGSNYPIQDKYIWPWSHPALLFSLLVIAAGGIGVLSGFRKTYTSIFAFFTLSLLSALLCTFLIAYYAIIAHWHLYYNQMRKEYVNASNIDFTLSIVMQVLSSLTFVTALTSAIYTAIAAGICPCQSEKAPLIKNESVKTKRKRLNIYYN